jgi:transcriptional regulator with XRE-family HTH domain
VKLYGYELARLARVHKDTLSEVETGKRKRPHRKVLFAIERALRMLEGRLSER